MRSISSFPSEAALLAKFQRSVETVPYKVNLSKGAQTSGAKSQPVIGGRIICCDRHFIISCTMKKYSYQPPRSAREIKADELTETVRAIVEKEKAELEAKLKRLRLARAERDALHQQQLPQEAIPPGGGKVRVGKRRSTTTPPTGEGGPHAKSPARK